MAIFRRPCLDHQSGEQLDQQVYFGEPLKRAVAAGEYHVVVGGHAADAALAGEAQVVGRTIKP